MKRREQIIESASKMFIQQGIKSVRMDDIARQLGVSKRTLYELFDDKEELLYLALCHSIDERHKELSELVGTANDVVEEIFMILREAILHSEVQTRIMTNLQKFYPSVYDKLLRTKGESHRKSLKESLDRGIAEGLFVDVFNLDLAISVLYYTASGLTIHRDLILPERMTESEAFIQIISNFFRGIATNKGLELIDHYRRRYELTGKETNRTNETADI